MEKNDGFIKNDQNLCNPRSHHSDAFVDTFDGQPRSWETIDDDYWNHGQISQDIDQFIDTLSTIDDKLNPPHILEYVETFSSIVELRIAKYYLGKINTKFGKIMEKDAFFIEAIKRVSKLANAFSEFSSSESTSPAFNRISMVLQRAMAILEEEFRLLLEDNKTNSQLNSDFF